jgi:hypothetical protein
MILAIANEYGNVDITRKVPGGYVHISGKRLHSICVKLKVKYAPAVVGWAEYYGKYKPIIDGVVVSARSESKVRAVLDVRVAGQLTAAKKLAVKQRKQKRDSARFADAIRQRFPSMPNGDVCACADHATQIGSGRVGRSSQADDPVVMAVVAYARHGFTDYDHLLSKGDDREDARNEVNRALREIITGWEKQP